jgi:hypothetical protein
MALYDSLIYVGRTVWALCATDKKEVICYKGHNGPEDICVGHMGTASVMAGTLPWSVAGSDGCLNITYSTFLGESMNNVQTSNTRL